MALERTLSIIKPDAVGANRVGAILSRIEMGGLKIVGSKMVRLSLEQARRFYLVHEKKPFYSSLVQFMSEGPVLVSVLEGENGVALYRSLMGDTDPAKAAVGTIRHEFGQSIDRNAVHGSDSLENGEKEIAFFFQRQEIYSRSCGNARCCCG